jgi:hypothetical protein
VFGIEVDGKRKSVRFSSADDAKQLKAALVTQGHKVRLFQYSKPEVEAMTRESADVQFIQLGVQYYVAARAAARAGLLPVCGNLYHHAVEMFLKSGLVRTHSMADLKNTFGHRLPQLWSDFKTEFPAPILAQYDQLIKDIEDFEEIRYPEKVIKQGAVMILGYRSTNSTPAGSGSPQRQEPIYTLYYDDVDRLIGELFTVLSRNPLFFLGGLKPEIKALLADGIRLLRSFSSLRTFKAAGQTDTTKCRRVRRAASFKKLPQRHATAAPALRVDL